MSTTTKPNLKDRALNNVAPWRSAEKPGLRINWLKLLLAVVTMVAVYWSVKLGQTFPGLYSFTSFVASLALVIPFAFGVFLLITWRKTKVTWRLVLGIMLLVVGLVLVPFTLTLFGVNLITALIVLVTSVVVLGCFLGIGLTRWYPHNRPTRNQNEL